MKRIIIGVTLFIGGLYTVLSIIQSAATVPPSFAGSPQTFTNAPTPYIPSYGLGLFPFFVIGILFTIVGLVILGKEYFNDKKKD